jgi:hypothetical protein
MKSDEMMREAVKFHANKFKNNLMNALSDGKPYAECEWAPDMTLAMRKLVLDRLRYEGYVVVDDVPITIACGEPAEYWERLPEDKRD